MKKNPSFIFTLIQKFNKPDEQPIIPNYDILIISDEAHRTQNGVFADNMMHLQRTLTETEEQLSAARRSFNAAVMDYNNSLQTFPSNILAGMFGFQKKTFFEAQESERKNVEVKF